MSDLYAAAHGALTASQTAWEAGSYLTAILRIQDAIAAIKEIIPVIGAAATALQV